MYVFVIRRVDVSVSGTVTNNNGRERQSVLLYTSRNNKMCNATNYIIINNTPPPPRTEMRERQMRFYNFTPIDVLNDNCYSVFCLVVFNIKLISCKTNDLH